VSIDVLMRKLLSLSLGGADELCGYAFAIGTAWALPFTLLRRANVRVDAVYVHLPQAARAALDLVAMLALGAFVAALTWQAWEVLQTSIAFDAHATTPLQTPLWIPQALWVAGLALFAFTWLPLFLRSAQALLLADSAAVNRLIGAPSMEESAAVEIAHTRYTEAP
jgi:TRAP-type C4-dicarboxylate transport system permease small subunit